MIKVIITGATGMVGEGVLLHCLQDPQVEEILMVNRRHEHRVHPKLKELIIPDFLQPAKFSDQLKGFDACFFCAGISSIGMNEKDYTRVTYDTTMEFARVMVASNPGMVFCYVSGAHTDSSEKGTLMWARVKGKTENDLLKLGFKKVYNFRPGFMKPVAGQQNIKKVFKMISALYPLFKLIMPGQLLTLDEVGQAMINSVTIGYLKNMLEISDIRSLSILK